MREKRVPDSTWICENKDFTVGDLKRTLNKAGILKILDITNLDIDSYHHQGKVCVKTENGEITELELVIIYSTDKDNLYRVCLVNVPGKDSKKIYDIRLEFNAKKDKTIFKETFVGEEIYKDGKKVGKLSFSENSIFGAKIFDNNTGLYIYAGRKMHGIYALCGDAIPKANYEDYNEFGEYFASINLPISIQGIYENLQGIFATRHYEYVNIYSFDTLTPDLEDMQNYTSSLFERLIDCTTVENGRVTVYATACGNESFTVYKDRDYWLYSDGEVVIRKMPIYDAKPVRLRITISFKDEETALKRMGNINLERILNRITELQNQLNEVDQT